MYQAHSCSVRRPFCLRTSARVLPEHNSCEGNRHGRVSAAIVQTAHAALCRRIPCHEHVDVLIILPIVVELDDAGVVQRGVDLDLQEDVGGPKRSVRRVADTAWQRLSPLRCGPGCENLRGGQVATPTSLLSFAWARGFTSDSLLTTCATSMDRQIITLLLGTILWPQGGSIRLRSWPERSHRKGASEAPCDERYRSNSTYYKTNSILLRI